MHTGLFQMKVPYFTNATVVLGDDGRSSAYSTPVDLFIGSDFDLEEGKIATIILYEQHTTIHSYIEDLITILVKGYLGYFLDTIELDNIHWVLVYQDALSEALVVEKLNGVSWNKRDQQAIFENRAESKWYNEDFDAKSVPWFVDYVLGDREKYHNKKHFLPKS